MTVIKNTTGTKAVNIKTDGAGQVIAMFVQIYNGQEQVLETKYYSTINRATKWAQNKLS